MIPTNKRSRRRALAEMVPSTLVMLLSVYLGMLLFYAFEPTLVRGEMRGLRIFLGALVVVLGGTTFILLLQRFAGKPHSELRYAALTLIIGPLEYLGVALVLDTLIVG